MKSLKTYLEDIMATPINTTGMGDVMIPTENSPGSGDMLSISINDKKSGSKLKKRKKFKRHKSNNEWKWED